MNEEQIKKILSQDYDLQFMNPYTAFDVVKGFKEWLSVRFPELIDNRGGLDDNEADKIVRNYEGKKRTAIQFAFNKFMSLRQGFIESTIASYSDMPRKFAFEMMNSIYQFDEDFIEALIIENEIEWNPGFENTPGYAINMILCSMKGVE